MNSKVIFGLSILGLVAAVSMTAVAHADPICGTLEQCRAMQARVEARNQESLRDSDGSNGRTWNFGEIVRNADGSVRNMTQHEAEEYCLSKGFRLPNIKELALLSQSLGARGIRETAYWNVDELEYAVREEQMDMRHKGYSPIYRDLGYKRTVYFYFNFTGYQRPAGDLGNHFFWSSTRNGSFDSEFHVLRGDTGSIFHSQDPDDERNTAVRCMWWGSRG